MEGFWLHSVLIQGEHGDDVGDPYIFSKKIKRDLFDPFSDVEDAEEKSLRDTVLTLLGKTIAEYEYDDGNVSIMSTADADDPSAVNGRLRPRKSSLAGPPPPPPPRPPRPARKPNDDKTKKPSTPTKKPPEKTEDPNKSVSYLKSLCPYCSRRFGSRNSVSKHIGRTHSSGIKSEPIECQFCKHSEVEAGDIVRHMVDSHPNQYFACLECHSRFASTAELAVHKLHVCERQKPHSYRNKLRPKPPPDAQPAADFAASNHFATPDFNGIVISCELKPSQEQDTADIEDNITTNVILPPSKSSLVSTSMLEKNAVIVLDDIQWNKRMPPNFTFHNSDADQILSRLGVVHRSPRTSDNTRWYKHIEDTTKFERCFDTSFYSKVASNVQENLNKFLDGSFNRFQLDPENVIKTRRAKNSVVINTAEGFPILLAHEQYSRNMFDSYMPRAIAPKHKWKWDSIESDRHPINPDQIKRDSHVNNCIITLVSSLDIWTQLRMRRKFEAKFNISSFNEKKTEKQNMIMNELKEILESREIPRREGSGPAVKYSHTHKSLASTSTAEFPGSLGLMRSAPPCTAPPAVLSGEWVRPRCYVCCACGEKAQDSKQLSAHIATQHPVAQVSHYEVVGELLLGADILKHLYVPPSQPISRSRPLRGVRECTKCKKPTTLEELHQHMLECAGDTPVVRRKGRSRPFGVRRRRTRLPDDTPRKKGKSIRSRQARQKNHMRPRPRIRTEVGDAETIRKMIADLPAKRHRASVTPTNPMVRPRRKREQPRNKLLMKRRPSDDPKNKKQRGSKDFSSPGSSGASSKDAGTSGKNPGLSSKNPGPSGTQRNPKIVKPRISRIATKVMRQSDVFKRKTLMRNAKKKARAIIEAASKEHFDDPSLSTSSSKTVVPESLAAENTPNRIDVNKGGGNPRGHAAREGNGSQEERKTDGNDNEQAQNGQNNRSAQNTPLKHSIARLTAATETHDKSVQFQPHFLVQQECYKNVDRPYRPVEPQRLFENDIAAAKLDKPPLFDLSPADLQKNKANKPRKGLNDCIAMLKNKLVEPSSPSASTGHRSVQCDTADMPQYATPPMPHLPEYITHPLHPASESTSPVSVSPPAAAFCSAPSVAREIALSPPSTSAITSPINAYLTTPPSLSITPFNVVPSTVTRSSRYRSSSKPSVTVTRSSPRSSATARSRSQKQSMPKPDAAAMSPPGRSYSTDRRVTTRRSPVKPPLTQPMGPPCAVVAPASAKSPVTYTPWALSKSPVNIRPPSPARSPVNHPQSGSAKSPLSLIPSPPKGLDREMSPGYYSQKAREQSPGYGFSAREKSPANYVQSPPSKSPVNYLPLAPVEPSMSYPPQASGPYMRDKSPGNYTPAAPPQLPLLYMPQSYAQSPATYPPRAPERLPINYPPQASSKSPVNYPPHAQSKSPVNHPAHVTAKSPVNYPPHGTSKSPVSFVTKPIVKSPACYIQPAAENTPAYYPPREPVAISPVNFTHAVNAMPTFEIPVSKYLPQAPAKSPVSFTSQPPFTCLQSAPSKTSVHLISPAPVKSSRVEELPTNDLSPPVKEPLQTPPKPVECIPPAIKVALTVAPPTAAKSPNTLPPAPLNLPPPGSLAVATPTTSSYMSASSPSAIKPPVPMTPPGITEVPIPAIPPLNNPRSMDTENKYPLLQMGIPPAHAHTSAVPMISPLDLSGKSTGPISLVKSTYDSYETLDLSNKGANSDKTISAIKSTTVTKDDIVDLCIKKSTSLEIVESLDLSAKIHKKDTSQILDYTEPVKPTELLNQLPEAKKGQEKPPKAIPVLGSDKSIPKPMYDPTLKIPQFKIRPTTSTCTTSDEKDPSVAITSATSSNTASDTKTYKASTHPESCGPSTKEIDNEEISNTPDTTMIAPNTTQVASKEKESKEAQSTLTPIAASIAACSTALSSTMSSQLATSLMNSLVSLPRSIDTAVIATTSTTCTTSTGDQRSEIVVPIGSVEDLETAKKIAMLPKEILEILGKMPTDHRNQLLDVLPQYMVYNNAVKQLKLVVDISSDSITSPIGIAKLASSKSEIATQTSSTSTEEVCPPEFLNVDTEKFLIDPFTGAITERVQQESEVEKPEQDEVIDMSKDANTEKGENKQVNPPEEQALNLMAAKKDIPETVEIFTIPPVVKQNKHKESSEKTASLRAVRIKTSERRISQQNLNNLIGKAVQQLPLVSNNVIPEKEELRAQLEVKTPPAIQQAEVSSTQQNGNKNIAVDSTSPVATKDMNMTTQNKERRTSTGIDEHDSGNNSLNVEDTTLKVSVATSIVKEMIHEIADDKVIQITSAPESRNSPAKKPARKPLPKVLKEVEVLTLDKKITELPAEKSTLKNKEVIGLGTAKVPDSDDSDDDISLAVILKKKKLDQQQQPKYNHDGKKDSKRGRYKKTKHDPKDISDILPPNENIENIVQRNQNAMKDLPIESSENKIQLVDEVEADELTAQTKRNSEPPSKKKKGRRRFAKKQTTKDMNQGTEEATVNSEFDIKNTTYYDKENNDESSNVSNKNISEKLVLDSVLTEVETRVNHSKPVHTESEIAKQDLIAKTNSSLEKANKNAPIDENLKRDKLNIEPDVTESAEVEKTHENISMTQTIEPNITEKKTNLRKKSKKCKKYDLEKTTTNSGTSNSEFTEELREKVSTEECPKSAEMPEAEESKAKFVETPKAEESKVKFAKSPNIILVENPKVEEDMFKTKSGRSTRSKAKDSPKTMSSDDLALSLSSDDALKPLRRSRRGKSMYVETPILDTPESMQTDIYMENKAPLTKKQLIFSKLLLDEENNSMLSTNSAITPDVEEANSVEGLIEEPVAAKADHSDFTPDVTIDETTPVAETVVERRKSTKRKKSPYLKQHSKRKKSYEKDQYECTLLHAELTSKEYQQSPKEKLQLEINIRHASEVVAKIDTVDDNEEPSKQELHEIITPTKDDTEKLETKVDYNHKNKTDEEIVKSKETKGKSRKSQHSTDKRKCDRAINVTATPSPKVKKTKKQVEDFVKTVDEEKPSPVEDVIEDTSVRRNEPTKMTTCYDMPRAAARTRAKSLLFKSFMDEIYDPYDIDLEDKLLQEIEPITKKTQPIQDRQGHETKTICKDSEKQNIKLKSHSSISSDDLNHTVTSSHQAITSNGKDSFSDSDSSKSDVPLKKYADENAKAHKKTVKADETGNPEPEVPTSSERIVKRKTSGKRKKKVDEIVDDQEESPEKQLENAEELRSEQFMESFGFFSERKPRKSNLLASKKISETFHIIANENDDFYFRNKEKAAKRGDRRKSASVSHTYDLECTARGIAHCHARRGRRGRRKRVPNPLTFCEVCRKEFRRPDNYLRHQMTLIHISRLSAKDVKTEVDPLPDIPNYLVIYRQHLERLRRLTEKLQKKNKKLGLDPSLIKIPTIQDIIADAKIHQYNLQKNNVRRGLSRDEALFLHCCELLKSNQNEIPSMAYSNRVSETVTSRSVASTSTIVMATTSTVTGDASTSKCNDGDVDSITAKTIMESEEVRNLENDLISGIKEAVSQNLAAAVNQRNYDYDTGMEHTSDLDAHDLDLDSSVPELEARLSQHRQSSGDELTDKLSSPKTGDSPFEELDSAEEPARVRVRKTRRSAAKLSEMLDIDLFEDKFDKIKRKCRSQAAAAKNTPPVTEPQPSTSGMSYKVKKKAEKKKAKKSSKNQNMIMTKGALKGFDGFKVSIPTSDINMAAIVSGLSECPRKKRKGTGKNRIEPPASGKYDLAQPGPSSRAHDEAQPGPSGMQSQGNLDVYEFLDNDDADLFPSAVKDRYKTFKHVPAARTDLYQRDDDSASGSDGDDFVYMSDDYPCSADETENSVMSCELKPGLEPKKSALKRKDAVEKNAVMGKIFKNNAVRSDKKSIKGKEPAKSATANLDQLFDSLLEDEPQAGPSRHASPRRDKGRATPIPNSDSDSEPFGAASPVPPVSLVPPVASSPQRDTSPERRQELPRLALEARRWAPSSMLSPSSTLEDPQPGTSRDSLPYDLSDGEADGGVARHRARRKCTVGKQNVLAESWSSESEPDGGTARANSTESVLMPVGRKKKGKKGNGPQQAPKRVRHVTFKKQEIAPEVSPSGVEGAGAGTGAGAGASAGASAAGGRPPSYTWLPEGEAGPPTHAPQHGWIVGNSHKKLVTMLAHAKGRRREDKRSLDE